MGLLERVNSQVGLSRPKNLSLDEYASWFSYGGVNYPMLQTTYSTLDQERIAWSADQAARRSGPVFSLVLARMQVFSQIRFAWTRFTGAQPGPVWHHGSEGAGAAVAGWDDRGPAGPDGMGRLGCGELLHPPQGRHAAPAAPVVGDHRDGVAGGRGEPCDGR